VSDEIRIVRADSVTPARLAELFTAAYEGYPVPIHTDEAALAFMVQAFDLHLSRSPVAFRGDAPLGLAVLGLRGRRGWVGGMGVIAAERRAGVGRRLMHALIDEARAAGVEELGLEVLEPNGGAISLYEQLGFRRTRLLEVWSLDAEAERSDAAPVALERARAWIAENRSVGEPWQRADETVERLLGVGHELEALEVAGRGAAVFRAAGPAVSILQLVAHDEEAAVGLLAAMRARGDSVRFVNVVEGDPASAALRRLGGRLDIRQLEMALQVAPAGLV
jgi:ribosomal protein S18 acetylase RimI-like enzyme